MRKTFSLDSQRGKSAAIEAIKSCSDNYVCEIKEQARNTEQNRLMWAILQEISDAVDWYGKKLTPDEWKSVFSASLKQQKVVPGLDGGFVVCAQSTSRMGKREFSDLIELIFAFGAEKGVRFPDVHHMDMAAA